MGPRGLLVVVAAALAATDVAAVEPGCPASNVGINVIRAADGSRTEVVGELPELPHGTRELSYGPTAFCNDFDGIIVVGGPVAFDPADTYYAKSIEYMNAAKMFVDWVNGPRGGLNVGGLQYGIRMRWIGDGSDPSQSPNATAHAIRKLGADFVMPSYGSGAVSPTHAVRSTFDYFLTDDE
jgi:hypothetical protein